MDKTPLEYIKSTLTEHYADFSGRAGRAEFWWFQLFAFIAGILALAPAVLLDVGMLLILSLIVFLALFFPSLAVVVRRLHDTDRSGWWYAVGLIPFVGGIILLMFLLQQSSPGTNDWGASPTHRG